MDKSSITVKTFNLSRGGTDNKQIDSPITAEIINRNLKLETIKDVEPLLSRNQQNKPPPRYSSQSAFGTMRMKTSPACAQRKHDMNILVGGSEHMNFEKRRESMNESLLLDPKNQPLQVDDPIPINE